MMQDFSLQHLVLRDGNIAIRTASANDEPLLTQWFNDPAVYAYWGGNPLSKEQIAAHCRVQIDDDTCRPFIIMQNDEPAGFMQAWVRSDMAGGLDLFIAPAHRGKGIARRALQLLASYLRGSAGWKRITVDPQIDNTRAIAAFESAGFYDTGERFREGDYTHMVMAFK